MNRNHLKKRSSVYVSTPIRLTDFNPHLTPKLILETRENLHMSRAVFALALRVSLRTLEKWEQGETVPNDQAVALILMVRKYPDTLKRLKDIDIAV